MPYTNAGINYMHEVIVGKRVPQTLILRLFINDVVPNAGTERLDLVEAEGYGYMPVNLDPAKWITSGGVSTYPQVIMSFSGPLGQIFGCYLTVSGPGTVLWAGRFENPYIVYNAGDDIKLTPIIPLGPQA